MIPDEDSEEYRRWLIKRGLVSSRSPDFGGFPHRFDNRFDDLLDGLEHPKAGTEEDQAQDEQDKT